MARRLPPFECEITELGARGVGVGTAPDGHRVEIRGVPPGARVGAVATHRSRSAWTARRTALIRPPSAYEAPRCAQFGLCGGCTLQEMPLDAQRAAKLDLALREVGPVALAGARNHGLRGAADGYAYRNKVELSFGRARYVSAAEHAAGAAIDGRFLGFHAPGRFDRVVDAPRCEIASEAMNGALGVVRAVALHPDAPPPYDAKAHVGFWRHLALREAPARPGSEGGGLLCVVYTTSDPHGVGAPWIDRLAEALLGSAFGVVGVEWRVGDGVADVARGDVHRRWGAEQILDRIAGRTFAIRATSFFQTNTAGAELLYATVADALRVGGAPASTLVDLYCGVGAIGITIADGFERVLGVEENAGSVEDARENAARNGVRAEFVAAKVEDVLPDVAGASVVVDPPRAGLHPRVAEALARAPWHALVYVACNPASLGRDAAVFAAAGVRLTDVWAVDLFPQTGHIELVGRFAR